MAFVMDFAGFLFFSPCPPQEPSPPLHLLWLFAVEGIFSLNGPVGSGNLLFQKGEQTLE